MNANSSSIPAGAPVTTSSWLRRLGLRATVSTFMLTISIVGFASLASASPEMGC